MIHEMRIAHALQQYGESDRAQAELALKTKPYGGEGHQNSEDYQLFNAAKPKNDRTDDDPLTWTSSLQMGMRMNRTDHCLCAISIHATFLETRWASGRAQIQGPPHYRQWESVGGSAWCT